jgi:transposase-like protein
MNASQVFCPNLECKTRGQVGQGNSVIHGRKRPRYRCKTCGKTESREGAHCQKVHEAIIEQASLDLVHVQADEIRVKGRAIVVWMGWAMMVSTRLW